ncbi:MAG TPA: metallophosphoesterase family protein [Bacteroidales bacterium]|nr:metallophosphoesterase family protein [Bacteroidales bacterium]
MQRLIAISDIHGCFDPFYDLVVNRIKLSKKDKLVLLGDYIDRGAKSREVIDFIMELIASGYNLIPLSGNHESLLADSFHDPSLCPLWFMNGGETTLDSFGIKDISKLDHKYQEFFFNLELLHRDGKYLFVHAGFNDKAADPFSDKYYMIWESSNDYFNPVLADYTIIHGHRPKAREIVLGRISSGSKVIPIDTGCVYGSESGYGFLSALILNDMELVSLECR